ncbi:MAG: hypothetical protein J1F11_03210 [Oscillospiraceae bacterium]|nr:hypothetical protein [Oscillospiraceae bacterium]
MKKFAIYRSETGFYYEEYIENMEQLAGTRFEKIVTEDMLPIIINENGGFHRFSEKDYGFVRFMESDKECPLKIEEMYLKNDLNFKLGWISPEGDTYSCSYTNHLKAAGHLAEKFCPGAKLPERALGKAGWLKVIDSWDGVGRTHSQFVYSISGKITKQQADTLFDLGLYNNEEVRKLIDDCEQRW